MSARLSIIFCLFMMTITGTICVRHEFIGPFLARLRLAEQQPPEILDDVLSYDEIYNDIKYPDQVNSINNNMNNNNNLNLPNNLNNQINNNNDNNNNYLSNWPVLRDYVQSESNDNYFKKSDLGNGRASEPLDEIPEPLTTPPPSKMKIVSNKNYNEKRTNSNNHYMSLCHFKICNMGRKRNTRYLHLWNLLENFKQSLRNKFNAM